MKKVSLHDKAVRLAEGGYVESNGLIIAAKLYSVEIDECYECEMDCICDLEKIELCCEVHTLTGKYCTLYLPSERKNNEKKSF